MGIVHKSRHAYHACGVAHPDCAALTERRVRTVWGDDHYITAVNKLPVELGNQSGSNVLFNPGAQTRSRE